MIDRPDLTKKGYKIIEGGKHSGIKCLDCTMVSYNVNDINNRYCGNCHKFHPKKKGIDV